MRQDKDIAFKLRKEGKTYRQIQNELGISRSTLCDWFKNEDWSRHIKNNNNTKNISISIDRLLKLHEGNREKYSKLYEIAEGEAIKEFEIFRKDPLFMAGLMIYAGEGDKRNRNNSRVCNSDFYIHNIFIQFVEKYLYISKSNIKLSLVLYPDNDVNECINKWSEELSISINNFYKTQVIIGKEKIKKLQYGVGTSIISSRVVVKKKILKWLELSSTMKF